jgi:hypothetical protein
MVVMKQALWEISKSGKSCKSIIVLFVLRLLVEERR